MITPLEHIVEIMDLDYGIGLKEEQISNGGMSISFPTNVSEKVMEMDVVPTCVIFINPNAEKESDMHGTIAHESFHATVKVLEWIGCNSEDPAGEEVTAYLISYIASNVEVAMEEYRTLTA